MTEATRGVAASLLLLLLLTVTAAAGDLKSPAAAARSLEAELESSLLPPDDAAKPAVAGFRNAKVVKPKTSAARSEGSEATGGERHPGRKYGKPASTESKSVGVNSPTDDFDYALDGSRMQQLLHELLTDQEQRSLRVKLEPEVVKKTVGELKEEVRRRSSGDAQPSKSRAVRMRRSMESSMSMAASSGAGRRRHKRDLGSEYDDIDRKTEEPDAVEAFEQAVEEPQDPVPPLTMFVANVKGEPGLFVPFDQEGAAAVAEAAVKREAQRRQEDHEMAEQLVGMLEERQAAERAAELAEAEALAEAEIETNAEAEAQAQAEAEAEAVAEAEAEQRRQKKAAAAQAELRRFAEKLASEEDEDGRALF